MFEVTKYKEEFTVEVEEALSMVFVLSPIVRLSVCGQVFSSAYLKFAYGYNKIHTFILLLLFSCLPDNFSDHCRWMIILGVPGLYVLGVGPVSRCSGPGDH